MEYEDILYEKKDGIAVITLNRPEKMNSMTPAMSQSVPAALQDAKDDDSIRVLVLTGAGRGFCAGANVRGLRESAETQGPTPSDRQNQFGMGEHNIAMALYRFDKPTIAMVNGAAMGGGCDIALMCDMRIASEYAKFGEVYIKLGLIPANGGLYLLPRAIGLARACELLYTGDIIDAKEAERIGLVNKTVPADELEEETMDLARKIAMGPPIALRLTKRGIYECLQHDFDSAMNYASLASSIVRATEDFREGTKAFGEKRFPVFKGR